MYPNNHRRIRAQYPRRSSCLALSVGLAFALSAAVVGDCRAQALPADVQPCPQPVPPEPKFFAKPASAPFLVQAFLPAPAVYPYLAGRGRDGLIADAKCISNALETYIKAWLDGRVPSQIPIAFLPRGYNPDEFLSFTLVKPENVTADEQWLRLPAGPIGADGTTRPATSDPHNAYLVTPIYAPFGSKVLIEGDFPHARFFDVQASAPFEPLNYRFEPFGAPEVPLVDADISPDYFSLNPFLPGASRSWPGRHYHVAFRMAIGDPVQLNGNAFVEPIYRRPGNSRYASGLQFQGPLGATTSNQGHGRGIWDVGRIYVRYYGVDTAAQPLGGVTLPKVTYQLPDLRQFYIKAVRPSYEIASIKLPPSDPQEPAPGNSTAGWTKQTDICGSAYYGLSGAAQFSGPDQLQYVRDICRGIGGRNLTFSGPMGYEASNTSASTVNYFLRSMSLGLHKVVVLTGRLPTTPHTLNGDLFMSLAQARYWSLTGDAVPSFDEIIRGQFFGDKLAAAIGTASIHSIADEEVTTDAQHRYVIVLSRPEDRPANATAANGVTWVNWGVRGSTIWLLRWMTVAPDWSFAQSPTSNVLPASKATAYSATFEPSVLGGNSQTGTLGDLLPQVHYMAPTDFEALGANVTSDRVPIWKQ